MRTCPVCHYIDKGGQPRLLTRPDFSCAAYIEKEQSNLEKDLTAFLDKNPSLIKDAPLSHIPATEQLIGLMDEPGSDRATGTRSRGVLAGMLTCRRR